MFDNGKFLGGSRRHDFYLACDKQQFVFKTENDFDFVRYNQKFSNLITDEKIKEAYIVPIFALLFGDSWSADNQNIGYAIVFDNLLSLDEKKIFLRDDEDGEWLSCGVEHPEIFDKDLAEKIISSPEIKEFTQKENKKIKLVPIFISNEQSKNTFIHSKRFKYVDHNLQQ